MSIVEDSRPCATFTFFELNQVLIGGTTIDLDTGEVTLKKPVSEAAQAFWDAVEKLIISRRKP